MGWHQSILIRPASLDGGADKFLADLGYEKRRMIENSSFSGAGAGSIWIGSIHDCVVICTYLALGILNQDGEKHRDVVELQNALTKCFPEADIVVLYSNTVVAGWGFAIFRNGVLIRRQHGYEGTTECDEGPRLPIEEEFFAKFERVETPVGVEYKDPGNPEYDSMSEADLGEDLVEAIGSYYTGSPSDALDIQGTSFWINDDEHDHLAEMQQYRRKSQTRPWWKFWG